MLWDLGDNQANPNPQLHEMIGEYSNQVTTKTEFDHHFHFPICVLWHQPHFNPIKYDDYGAFFILGHIPRATTWSQSQPSTVQPAEFFVGRAES